MVTQIAYGFQTSESHPNYTLSPQPYSAALEGTGGTIEIIEQNKDCELKELMSLRRKGVTGLLPVSWISSQQLHPFLLKAASRSVSRPSKAPALMQSEAHRGWNSNLVRMEKQQLIYY